jgi:hypothetical protein
MILHFILITRYISECSAPASTISWRQGANNEEKEERVMRQYSRYLVFVLALTLLCSVQPAFSQTAEEFKARQKEIDALKEGQAGLRKDIQDLKKSVGLKPAAAPAAPAPEIKDAVINIKGAPIKGDKNAKLVFIEFSDYQ